QAHVAGLHQPGPRAAEDDLARFRDRVSRAALRGQDDRDGALQPDRGVHERRADLPGDRVADDPARLRGRADAPETGIGPGMEPILRIAGLRKSFGALEALKGMDLEVAQGETVVVLGASGSGKSTLLRCVNFLERPTAGRIALDGKAIGVEDANGAVRYSEAELSRVRTRIGMVF